MRSSLASKLLKGQDICLLCAFTYGAESQLPRLRPLRQARPYTFTGVLRKPAGAAVARKEEYDNEEEYPMLKKNAASHRGPDTSLETKTELPPATPSAPRLPTNQKTQNPLELLPDWACKCGHINLPNRIVCTACAEPKHLDARLYYPKDVQAPDPFEGGRPRPVRPSYPPSRKTIPRTQDQGPPSKADYTFNRIGPGGSGRAEQNARLSRSSDMPFSMRRGAPLQDRDVRRPNTNVRGVLGSDALDQAAQPRNRSGVVGGRLSETQYQQYVPRSASSGRGAGVFGVEAFEQASAPGNRPNNIGQSLANTRNAQSRPQEASTSRGTGVFGMAELEGASVSRNRSSPVRGGPPTNDGFGARHAGRAANRSSELSSRRAGLNDSFTGVGSRTRQPRDAAGGRGASILEMDGILPPASSSFESFEDRRRRERETNRSVRRSQRYEVDDETDNGQIRNDRNPGAKPWTNASSSFEEEMWAVEEKLEGRQRGKKQRKAPAQRTPTRPQIQLPDFVSVEQLARALKVRIEPFLRKLEDEGFEAPRYDHILDAETSAMLADTYGFEASFGGRQTTDDLMPLPPAEDKALLPPRPPIVTIMGHVDHGKTTILDWLRKSSVVASEHGGITQHIGAFSVTMPGSERQITFLDTPGHAAFLDMRRRGAIVTDIVVLVVAADDSVKPQTIEAIKHALEAKVHIIVAINKVDKDDANVDRVKQDLARNDITVEDYGGEYQAIALSGKTGKGMAELEEAITTLADVSDFRAEIDGRAEGWILESKVMQAGRVATVLVRRGTLRTGDFIVAGTTWARIRTLRNDAGLLVNEALPGTPVQVDGWRGEDPTAGLEVLQAENEEHAKDVVDIRLEKLHNAQITEALAAMNSSRTVEAEERAKVVAWESEQSWAKRKRKPQDNEGWVEGSASNGPKEVHFVVKADVAGSVEALVAAVSAVGNNEIKANIVHSGTGPLSESDIRHLAATGETAYAISFNQPVDGAISRLAAAAGLQILDHNIIYKVTDDVREKLSAELPPVITQRVLGEGEVGKVFEVTTKKGKTKIAGCKITNGAISRAHKVRVLRGGEVLYTGTLASLKNVKKDVTEMRKGSECGIGFEEWDDFVEGDQIQTFEESREKRILY